MKLAIIKTLSTVTGACPRALALTPLFLAASTGCGGAVDQEEGSAIATSEDALTVATNSVQLAYYGGGGGSPADAACDPGDVAIGLHGSSQIEQNLASLDPTPRRLVTRIGLICAHLEADGRLTGTYTTAALGNQANRYNAEPEPFWLQCQGGKVVRGMHGRAGRFLDAIGAFCGPVPYERPSEPPSHVKDGLQKGDTSSITSPTQTVGGDGGTPFKSICPPKYVVHRLTVRSGSWVDGVQAHCAEIVGPPPPPPAPPPPAVPQAPAPSKPITRPGTGTGSVFCPSCRR